MRYTRLQLVDPEGAETTVTDSVPDLRTVPNAPHPVLHPLHLVADEEPPPDDAA
jgi:hypothetical protein